MGLDKPWEEAGKEEPESLVEQLWAVRNRVRESAKHRSSTEEDQ
jgi:hypothetical protein